MSESSRFIDGIFNYCDRWCERCSMTRHCRVYEMELALEEAEVADLDNREFWQRLDERLELEAQNEDQWGEFVDVEPPTEEELEEFCREEEWQDNLIAGTDLAQAAESYLWEVRNWLDEHQSLHQGPQPRSSRQRDSLDLAGALDVVAWYYTLIAAKAHRALRGHQEREWENDEDALQSDWNGSAKVALMSVERSIGAWSLIRDHLPREQDRVRRFLARCGLIRLLLLEQFPDARAFVRPGFDEPTASR